MAPSPSTSKAASITASGSGRSMPIREGAGRTTACRGRSATQGHSDGPEGAAWFGPQAAARRRAIAGGIISPMTALILSFAFLVPSASVAARAPLEDPMTVVVRLSSRIASPGDASPGERLRSFGVVPGQTVRVDDLDTSETVEGAWVEVLGGSSEPPLRLQVQYETSISIVNRGPQIDFLDWKHNSAWVDLERDPKGRFRVRAVRDDERSQFPRVDPSRLLLAVRADGGDGWADLVTSLSGVFDHPAALRLTSIRIRVVDGAPDTAFVVEFLVPPGC